MITGIAASVIAYLLGGIPFGFLFYRMRGGRDIRSVGSGNIGATNVTRAAGLAIGILTLLLDAAKGSVGVLLGLAATGDRGWAAAAGMAAVVGHCFPPYLWFRGGKGVATGLGAFLLLDPFAMGFALVAFALGLGVARRVAVGSILASLTFPVAAWLRGGALDVALWSTVAGLLIIVRHHDNIRRILQGDERHDWGKGSEGAS
jgi:glycerol-3-phosphate acyltransferase PlsY